jgi:hypothetical protein
MPRRAQTDSRVLFNGFAATDDQGDRLSLGLRLEIRLLSGVPPLVSHVPDYFSHELLRGLKLDQSIDAV